jgi:beta-glucosidase
MTQDEKIRLVHGDFPLVMKMLPPGVQRSAGYVPGVPRLGIPALRESDASLGVANAGRPDDDATALPSGMAIASTWDPAIAEAGGAMIGKEARQKGFNVLLAGGVNLTRDPFNGRNFEYLGEDPLLAGTLDGAAIRGIQGQHVLSTAKHFVLNAQETGRHVLDARIGEAALRESDLLAFEIAIDTGHPGAVMCAYNRVNGAYACENPHLLDGVLKGDWGWKGWVMSDWGAVHAADDALAGLDQESGAQIDRQVYFDRPLRAALASGRLPQSRLDDMVHRILRSMFAAGLVDHPLAPGGLETAADAPVAQRAAEAGIVLLKNQGGLLPLAGGAGPVVVIGGHADVGVLSGGGSSQVVPRGSTRLPPPDGSPPGVSGVYLHPSPPLAAIRARTPQARFESGEDIEAAAAAARSSAVAIVFATEWTTEGVDGPMRLSAHQETLIRRVAAANPKTVVVLETGGPILMPWLDQAPAVVEAWYPGSRGGEAVARILYGEVDPAGRLPVTFPARLDQLPRREPVGLGKVARETFPFAEGAAFSARYAEGSSMGYRWFAERGETPLFPFGYGLSYTDYGYSGLKVTGGKTLTVSVAVTNRGRRPGVETAEVYLRAGPRRRQERLIGWAKARLAPGETRRVIVRADRRLLASWDESRHAWRLDGGRYRVFVGRNAGAPVVEGSAFVEAALLKP